MKLRVGVIGLGNAWESRHRGALRALSDRFEVRAVCAEVAGLARQAAGEFGAELVGGFRALASREDVEAVLVLSPDWYGPLPILAACDAGKAVYCASPLDLDLQRSDEVRQRVEQSGVAFMVEFPRRHAPATVRLRELIATRLGRPWLLLCHGRDSQAGGDELRSTGSRYRPPTEDPGWQSMVEMIDWCNYIADSPVNTVTASDHAQGMTDREALASATTMAARVLEMENEIGRLAPGYSADIIAVDGDPLADVTVLEDVDWVMVRGRVID